MVEALQGLQEVQEITRGAPDPSKKEVLKVQKALILGIGAAIGKQTGMDQHFVNEATKLLYDKSTKLEAELATFNETVDEYAKKTRTMEATVEQLTTELNARMEEQANAKKHQKECVAAVKDSEKHKKAGDKSLEKAVSSRDDACQNEGTGKETKTQFTFLFERSIIEPAVEEVVEEAAKAASPVASSPVAGSPAAASPLAASPGAAVAEAAPEAAMEVEPVA